MLSYLWFDECGFVMHKQLFRAKGCMSTGACRVAVLLGLSCVFEQHLEIEVIDTIFRSYGCLPD